MSPGTVLGGRYELTRLLTSAGKRPQRWAATDNTLKREVTVVTFPMDGVHAGAALDSARRVASTVDQRLARVLDVGDQGDLAFIVVESLEHAQSLEALARDGRLHPEEARRIIGEAASALESARLRGLHHQLLAPGHIRVAKDGSVSVSGVATAAALVGLEETSSADASAADTTGLAACLYAALTGTWPLDPAACRLPRARRHADGTLALPGEVTANVPHDLDDLVSAVLPLGQGDDPLGRDDYGGPRTPGEVARDLAPWSADPITADVAHLDHVAAPAPVATAVTPLAATAAVAGQDDAWGADSWDEADDEAWAAGAGESFGGGAYRDEYDEGYDSGEIPGGLSRLPAAAPPPKRSRSQAGVTIALVGGLVLAAIALCWLGLKFMADNPWNTPKGVQTTAAPATAGDPAGSTAPVPQPAPEATAPAETSTTSAAAGGEIKPAGASLAVSDQIDGRTFPISHVVDGKPETFWTSMFWSRQDRSANPVGIVVDLGGEKDVKKVDVTFGKGTFSPQVYVSNSQDIQGATKIGEVADASGTWSAEAAQPAKGRYVILWFTQAGRPTKLAAGGGYPYAVQVAEVKVSG